MDRNAAFVNILAMADSASAYHHAVEGTLCKIGFDLIGLEDTDPLRQREHGFQVSDDLLALAAEVGQDGEPRFGSFHTWTSNDGDGTVCSTRKEVLFAYSKTYIIRLANTCDATGMSEGRRTDVARSDDLCAWFGSGTCRS